MNLRIAIVSPNLDRYSETFIHQHFTGLNSVELILYGDYLPTHFTAHFPKPGRPIPEEIRNLLGRKKGGPGQLLRNGEIEVVLCEYGPTGVKMANICAGLNLPVVVHFHGFDAYRSDVLGDYAEDYRKMWKQVAAVIAVSEDMKRQLLTLGAEEHQIHLVPYGIETDQFPMGNPAETPPQMLAVGRFVAKKGPVKTLEAFAKCKAEVPEARLVMVGDGPLWEEAKNWVNRHNLTDSVTFSGILSPADISAEMQKSRAFVQHSLRPPDGDSEGTPLAILEAGASALPVIATRHAGIPDVVIEGETGFLVTEGDVEGMAAHMIRVCQNPALAGEMGRKAASRIREFYTSARYLGTLQKLLTEVALGTKP